MKAASLGHQYLSVKLLNNNSSYFSGTRFRGIQKYHEESNETGENKIESTKEATPTPTATTAPPVVRTEVPQVTTIDESSLPSVAIIEPSENETSSTIVIYKSQKSNEINSKEHSEYHKPYSLPAILSKRRGIRDDNKKLRSRIRKFYRRQDRLIDSFEQLHENGAGESQIRREKIEIQKKHIDWLVKATLVLNCTLLVAKIVAAVFSRSLSIISSVVDSAVDSASACLLFWAVRAIKRRDPYAYPGGRTRLEPVIIVILSVLMVSASVQVIFESSESLADYINAFKNNSTDLRTIDMGPVPITVMCVTILTKTALSLLCFKISNPTMNALAHDHLNDVFANAVALVCGIIASKALQGAIPKVEVVVVDPIGAILISLYIIFCWTKQLREQVRNLSGYAAEPEFIQKLTWLTLNHSPLIEKIDTIRAFHFGTSFLVEVELILPESMTLKEAHDIGASLQCKLEKLSEVEIAFVRLDYEVDALK